jgi:glycine oxidase
LVIDETGLGPGGALSEKQITVVGAGVLGLWQALGLAKAGRRVRLVDASPQPFVNSASRWAGAMIAPECEAESAPPLVRDLGRKSLSLWRQAISGVIQNGTLVVAPARDQGELQRFARATEGHETLDEKALAQLEPDLAGRFTSALYYPAEAHMDAMAALHALLAACRLAGVEIEFGRHYGAGSDDIIVDCRGLGARADLKTLRGVRGERLVVKTSEVRLSRPVRLLHPRQPIYAVPQGDGRFVIGATVVEREDDGPMTVRSALELLGSAYALHPAFAEAAILDMGAGVRPALPDNIPRVFIEKNGRIIRVNGAYRHGFLLAPVLAEAVAGFVVHGQRAHALIS